MNLLILIGAALLSFASPAIGRVEHNVRYADGKRGCMDVYIPRRVAADTPLVVFVYGGSWQSGEKSIYRFVGAVLASRGFVTVIPDYRVYPQVVYPDFLRDNARAVAFARSHAAEWGADPNRLVLMGHSAGAYNVAMLALDRRWLAEVGVDPRRDIIGVVGLSGPYDFLPLRDPVYKTIFGPPDTLPDTQPINHVDGAAPPMLLFAGANDTLVDPGNSTRLAAAITARGGQATAKIWPRHTHVSMLTAILNPFREYPAVLENIVSFIDSLPLRASNRAAA
jgi:acetyl esterase/lipase